MRRTSIVPDDSGSFGVPAISANDLGAGSTPKQSVWSGSRRRIKSLNKENLLIAILVLLSVIMAAFFVLT